MMDLYYVSQSVELLTPWRQRHLIIEPFNIIFREPRTVRIAERSLTCDLTFAEQWSPR